MQRRFCCSFQLIVASGECPHSVSAEKAHRESPKIGYRCFCWKNHYHQTSAFPRTLSSLFCTSSPRCQFDQQHSCQNLFLYANRQCTDHAAQTLPFLGYAKRQSSHHLCCTIAASLCTSVVRRFLRNLPPVSLQSNKIAPLPHSQACCYNTMLRYQTKLDYDGAPTKIAQQNMSSDVANLFFLESDYGSDYKKSTWTTSSNHISLLHITIHTCKKCCIVCMP